MSRSTLSVLVGVLVLAAIGAAVFLLKARNPAQVAAESQPAETLVAPSQWVVRPMDAPDLDPNFSEALGVYLSFRLESVVGAENVLVDWTLGEDPEDKGVIRAGVRVLPMVEGGPQYELLIEGERFGGVLHFSEQGSIFDPMIKRGVDWMMGQVEPEAPDPDSPMMADQYGPAVDSFLHGMAAQFSGDAIAAEKHFEDCLVVDPGFDFARYELAIAVRRRGDYERALGLLNEVSLDQRQPHWQVRVSNARGITFWMLGRMEEAAYELKRAMALSARPSQRIVLAINLGLVQKNLGDFHSATVTLKQAIGEAEEAQDPRSTFTSKNALAGVYLIQGRLEEALPLLEHALELAIEVKDLSSEGSIRSRLANVQFQAGELDQPIAHLEKAYEIRTQIAEMRGAADNLSRLSSMHLVRGDFAQAGELALQNLELSLEIGDHMAIAEAHRSLAKWATARGDWELADEELQTHKEIAELADSESELAINQELSLALSFKRDPGQVTADAIDSLVAEARTGGHTEVANRLLKLRAQVNRLNGDSEAARADLNSALAAAQADHDHRLIAELHTELLDLLIDEDPNAALAQLENAASHHPFPYPFLKYRARVLAQQEEWDRALNAGVEARDMSGDWWNEDDEAMLEQIFRQRTGGKPSPPGP